MLFLVGSCVLFWRVDKSICVQDRMIWEESCQCCMEHYSAAAYVEFTC